MEKSGQWSLLEGDAEVIPGVELIARRATTVT